MAVTFTIDNSEISALSQAIAGLTGKFNSIAAIAMTNSAKAAKAAVAADTFPRIQGGPTPWTRRGLIASFASPDNLTSQVGFNYGEGKFTDTEFTRKAGGIPSGRYMNVNARGGDRRPKATELALRRTGLIPSNAFITPASDGVRLNSQGNLPGGQYQQLLSRLKALPEGSSQATTSKSKRRSLDYFLLRSEGDRPSRWQLGATPSAFAIRTGAGPKGGTGKGSGNPGRPQTVGYKRGFVRAFFITDQPNYESRFPISQVALAAYRANYQTEFEKALASELAYQARRR
jgi:hypothetical protein